ncbi:MAG: TetR/AcrR family transcriptional regulator C-terminal domain-containing protein [Candidatus Faecivicinus sp.]
MAQYTERAIIQVFREMLEKKPFDKITVCAIVSRCGISSNTFYYHFQDIYGLLDAFLRSELEPFVNCNSDGWKNALKALLRHFQENEAIVYHIFGSLSRDRLERVIFDSSYSIFERLVEDALRDTNLSAERRKDVSDFCRYSFLGFFLRFLWNRMSDDPDRLVDRLGGLVEEFITSVRQKDAAIHAVASC